MLERFNPSLYSEKDATSQLNKLKEKEYLLGTVPLDLSIAEDRGKVWSLNPDAFEDINTLVKEAKHFHYLPFIMGTYNMSTRQLRMNDACATDPYSIALMATGGIEGFATPFLRALYFIGRKAWWRHESIHARHHFGMAEHLTEKNWKWKWEPQKWDKELSLHEAASTIHESGIEELLTRWQSLKEADGLREKAVSTLALALYAEYSPFTGPRNAVIDAKEKTLDNIDSTTARRLLKLGIGVGSFAVPIYLNAETHFAEKIGELGHQLTPLAEEQIEYAVNRGITYIGISVVSALLSTKEKGTYKPIVDGKHLPTSEYKFPYVYNPVSATKRTIDLLFYLNKIWDKIPNYRKLTSKKEIDYVKREIADKISDFSDKERAFTMTVVEESLSPLERKRKTSFPQDVYVKGRFTPALYLNLKDKYL